MQQFVLQYVFFSGCSGTRMAKFLDSLRRDHIYTCYMNIINVRIRFDTAEIRRLNRRRILSDKFCATRPVEHAAEMQQPIQTSIFCGI